MKPPFKLGDKVIVVAIVEKQQHYHQNKTETNYEVQHLVTPVQGIYIGYRTAQTGWTRYDEDGPIFRPDGKLRYFLVVTDERRNPIKAYIVTQQ